MTWTDVEEMRVTSQTKPAATVLRYWLNIPFACNGPRQRVGMQQGTRRRERKGDGQ